MSDIVSGQDLSSARQSYERFPNFSTEELDTYFEQFSAYDIDENGFISAENLEQVAKALGCEMTIEQVKHMLEEVAILAEHKNDGRLSWRDFMGCIQYERGARAHNHKVEAEQELAEATESLRLSEAAKSGKSDACGEAEGEGPVTATEAPVIRMRVSSFSVMNDLAKSRIATFQQVVGTTQEKSAPPMPSKFAKKLKKFEHIETGDAPKLNNEAMQQTALKTKLAAFEKASKADPVAVKKTWKNVKHGGWAQKTTFAGGVAPKKTIEQIMQERG